MELGVALVRASVTPGEIDSTDFDYTIFDLLEVSRIPEESFNVAVIQRSQLPWLFLFFRHFCDAFG